MHHITLITSTLRSVVVLTLCLVLVLQGIAQDSDSETTERKAKAELEFKEYEAQLKRAEAEGKFAENLRNQIAFLSGNPSVAGDAIETELIAIETLQCLSYKVWRSLPPNDIKNLVVFDPTAGTAVTDLEVIRDRITILSKTYNDALNALKVSQLIAALNEDPSLKKREKSTLSGLTLGVNVAAAVAGVFKEDVSIQGRMLTLDRDTFLSSFARHRPLTASSGGTSVNYSTVKVIMPSRIGIYPTTSKLFQEVQAFVDLRDRIRLLKPLYDHDANLRQRPVVAAQIEKETDPKAREELVKKLNKMDAEITAFRILYPAVTDQTVKEIIPVLRVADISADAVLVRLGLRIPDDVKQIPTTTLPDFLRAEKLAEILRRPKTYWIEVGTTKLGGSTRTRKGVITGVFDRSGQISFSGGSAVAFSVFGSDGQLLWSGTEAVYRPFKNSNEGISYTCN